MTAWALNKRPATDSRVTREPFVFLVWREDLEHLLFCGWLAGVGYDMWLDAEGLGWKRAVQAHRKAPSEALNPLRKAKGGLRMGFRRATLGLALTQVQDLDRPKAMFPPRNATAMTKGQFLFFSRRMFGETQARERARRGCSSFRRRPGREVENTQ